MSITVSVIIPTYGRSELLARAIDSVLAQTHRPLEIIVVDDNPQGDAHRLATRERLAGYIERGEIIYYPRRRNGGGALARDSGILRSSGQYISFLDDDDYYHPQKIARQLAFMQQGEYDVSLCDMDILKNGQISAEHYYRARCEGLEDFMLAGVAYTPMIMMRRSTAIAVRGFSTLLATRIISSSTGCWRPERRSVRCTNDWRCTTTMTANASPPVRRALLATATKCSLSSG